jgi:hypothetical protein
MNSILNFIGPKNGQHEDIQLTNEPTLKHPTSFQHDDLTTKTIYVLDYLRFALLKLLMNSRSLHHLYAVRHIRLFLRFSFLTVITFPIALFFPTILLIGGPVIFGYIHLIASYRYSGEYLNRPKPYLNRNTAFKIFAITTVGSILMRLTLEKTPLLQDIPFGVWEASVATLLLILVSWIAKQLTFKRLLTSILLLGAVIYCANLDPLIFIGAVLFIHNWIAMIYWIFAARTRNDKIAACCSTLVFGILHYIVIRGSLDHFIHFHLADSIFKSEIQTTGWILAPWSREPLIWARAIVIYTYGLSIHYFAWLSAIPECHSHRQYPNSFRISMQHLNNDLGRKTCLALLGIAILGTGLWLFSYSMGKNIYFSLATLHGWIEILFLL